MWYSNHALPSDFIPLHVEQVSLAHFSAHEEYLIPPQVMEEADDYEDGFALLSEYASAAKVGQFAHTPSYDPLAAMSAVEINKNGKDNAIDARTVSYPGKLQKSGALEVDFLLGDDMTKLADVLIGDLMRYINGAPMPATLLQHAVFHRPSLTSPSRTAWHLMVAVQRAASVWRDVITESTYIEYEDFTANLHGFKYAPALAQVDLDALEKEVTTRPTSMSIVSHTLAVIAIARLGQAALGDTQAIPSAVARLHQALASCPVDPGVVDPPLLRHGDLGLISPHYAARLCHTAIPIVDRRQRDQWKTDLVSAVNDLRFITDSTLTFSVHSFIDTLDSLYSSRDSAIFRCVFQRWHHPRTGLCGGRPPIDIITRELTRKHRRESGYAAYTEALASILGQLALTGGLTLSRATRVTRHCIGLCVDACNTAAQAAGGRSLLVDHSRALATRLAASMLLSMARLGDIAPNSTSAFICLTRSMWGDLVDAPEATTCTRALAKALSEASVPLLMASLTVDRLAKRPTLTEKDFLACFKAFVPLDDAMYDAYRSMCDGRLAVDLSKASMTAMMGYWADVEAVTNEAVEAIEGAVDTPAQTKEAFLVYGKELGQLAKANRLAMLVGQTRGVRSLGFDWNTCQFLPRIVVK